MEPGNFSVGPPKPDTIVVIIVRHVVVRVDSVLTNDNLRHKISSRKKI